MTEVKYDVCGVDIIVEYDENGIAKITRECFEALIEKQIPKEPDMYVTKFPHCCNVSKCPTCGQEFGFNDDFNYCENCGQRLKWGE